VCVSLLIQHVVCMYLYMCVYVYVYVSIRMCPCLTFIGATVVFLKMCHLGIGTNQVVDRPGPFGCTTRRQGSALGHLCSPAKES
jgi:hypothetical protein